MEIQCKVDATPLITVEHDLASVGVCFLSCLQTYEVSIALRDFCTVGFSGVSSSPATETVNVT